MAMTTYTNYKLVWGIGGDELEEEVRENLLKGYQPLGPPLASYDMHKSYWACAQAMVIEGPEIEGEALESARTKRDKEEAARKAKVDAWAAKKVEAEKEDKVSDDPADRYEANRKKEIEAATAKKVADAKLREEQDKAKPKAEQVNKVPKDFGR